MDGSEESTGTYPLLSGAAGYAFRTEPPADEAEPSPAENDDEPPTEEFDLPPAGPAIPVSEGPRRSRPVAAALLGIAVLLGVGVLVVRGLVTDRPDSAPVAAPPSLAEPAPPFEAGTFELAGDVGELNLSLGRTEGPVVVSAATASVDGTVVRVTTGGSNPARLDVTLDQRIAWTIRMNGGVRRATFVLTGGTVREVDLAGGADEVSLTMPEVDRVLPIRMSGGVREWSILTTAEVPVRVRVQSGAGEVSLYGKRRSGIARDTTLTAGDGSGLDVVAAAGFGSLAVRTPQDRSSSETVTKR